MSDHGDSVDPMTPDIELLDLQGWKDRRTRLYQVFQRFRSKVTLGIKLKQETVPSLYAAMEDAFGDVYHAHQQLVDFCTKNKVPDTLPGHELSKTSIVNKMALVPWLAHAESEYNTTVALYKTYMLSLVPAAPAAPQSQAQAQSSATPNPPVITSATASSTPLTGQTLRQLTSLYEKESWRFLGNPGREWAEWKCIYLCEIKPLFVGRPIALAQLLRILVKGGYGEKVISHVTLQEEKPDEKIFTALCSHYDNVGMNVACALSSFASLRASSDPQGIIENIRKIQSAHSQLQALGHTTQVDQTRVTQLVELFPASIQEQWYERFSGFDDQEKFHPLQQFVDFLKEKFASLEAKAICTRSMHPGRTQNKSSIRSHAMSSSSVDKNCVVHPNGNHSTQSCREFKGLSPKDRSRLCTKHKKCKLCLLDKHEGPCHADFSCTRCTGKLRNSHCTQLCFADESSKTPSAQASTHSVDKPYGSSQGKQFAPRSGHANAVDSSSNENQSPGSHNVPQAGFPHFQYGYPYMHPGITPFYPGAQNPAFHAGINQVANHATHNASVTSPPNQMYPVPYVYPGYHGVPFPYMGYPNVTSHGVSTDHLSTQSSGPGSGAKETTADPSPTDKKSAEVKHINLSSNLTDSMQFNVFTVSESTAKSTELPYYDNILSAPRQKAFGLYAIVTCEVANKKNFAVVFLDGGSDCSLILESSLDRLGARVIARGPMRITTVNGTETLDTQAVEVDLIDIAGRKRTVVGYTVKEIISRPYRLNTKVLTQEFPDYDPSSLQRPKQSVDILLGSDYFSLFPKQEVANNKKDLSIMFGPLGNCLQGSHPDIVMKSKKNDSSSHPNAVHVTFQAAHVCVTSVSLLEPKPYYSLSSTNASQKNKPVLSAPDAGVSPVLTRKHGNAAVMPTEQVPLSPAPVTSAVVTLTEQSEPKKSITEPPRNHMGVEDSSPQLVLTTPVELGGHSVPVSSVHPLHRSPSSHGIKLTGPCQDLSSYEMDVPLDLSTLPRLTAENIPSPAAPSTLPSLCGPSHAPQRVSNVVPTSCNAQEASNVVSHVTFPPGGLMGASAPPDVNYCSPPVSRASYVSSLTVQLQSSVPATPPQRKITVSEKMTPLHPSKDGCYVAFTQAIVPPVSPAPVTNSSSNLSSQASYVNSDGRYDDRKVPPTSPQSSVDVGPKMTSHRRPKDVGHVASAPASCAIALTPPADCPGLYLGSTTSYAGSDAVHLETNAPASPPQGGDAVSTVTTPLEPPELSDHAGSPRGSANERGDVGTLFPATSCDHGDVDGPQNDCLRSTGCPLPPDSLLDVLARPERSVHPPEGSVLGKDFAPKVKVTQRGVSEIFAEITALMSPPASSTSPLPVVDLPPEGILQGDMINAHLGDKECALYSNDFDYSEDHLTESMAQLFSSFESTHFISHDQRSNSTLFSTNQLSYESAHSNVQFDFKLSDDVHSCPCVLSSDSIQMHATLIRDSHCDFYDDNITEPSHCNDDLSRTSSISEVCINLNSCLSDLSKSDSHVNESKHCSDDHLDFEYTVPFSDRSYVVRLPYQKVNSLNKTTDNSSVFVDFCNGDSRFLENRFNDPRILGHSNICSRLSQGHSQGQTHHSRDASSGRSIFSKSEDEINSLSSVHELPEMIEIYYMMFLLISLFASLLSRCSALWLSFISLLFLLQGSAAATDMIGVNASWLADFSCLEMLKKKKASVTFVFLHKVFRFLCLWPLVHIDFGLCSYWIPASLSYLEPFVSCTPEIDKMLDC